MTTESPTIVLVHGAWHGSWCWDNVVGQLEEHGFNVVVPNLPGHLQPGSSSRIVNTMKSYVDHISSVVDSIDGDVVLVGHSMGGLITQRVLETRDVSLGILVASAPLRGVAGALLRLLRRAPRQVLESTATFNLWPMVSTSERAATHFFAPGVDPDVLEHAASQLQSESYVAFLSMLTRLPRPAKVKSPVAVIAAEADLIFSVDEQRSLAAAYDAPLVLLPCGHDLMLDTCWPQLADEIINHTTAITTS